MSVNPAQEVEELAIQIAKLRKDLDAVGLSDGGKMALRQEIDKCLNQISELIWHPPAPPAGNAPPAAAADEASSTPMERLSCAMSEKFVHIGKYSYAHDRKSPIVSVAGTDVSDKTAAQVYKRLRDDDDVKLSDGSQCVVQLQNKVRSVSSINSYNSWINLNPRDIENTDPPTLGRTVTVEPFEWGEADEANPSNMLKAKNYLSHILKLPQGFTVRRNTESPITLNNGIQLTGTIAGDFAIEHEEKGVVSFVLELKKQYKQSQLYQAGAELLVMEQVVHRPVPVLLTDLGQNWHIVFRAANGLIMQFPATRDTAVACVEQVTHALSLPKKTGEIAKFSSAPIEGFAFEVPKRSDIEL